MDKDIVLTSILHDYSWYGWLLPNRIRLDNQPLVAVVYPWEYWHHISSGERTFSTECPCWHHTLTILDGAFLIRHHHLNHIDVCGAELLCSEECGSEECDSEGCDSEKCDLEECDSELEECDSEECDSESEECDSKCDSEECDSKCDSEECDSECDLGPIRASKDARCLLLVAWYGGVKDIDQIWFQL